MLLGLTVSYCSFFQHLHYMEGSVPQWDLYGRKYFSVSSIYYHSMDIVVSIYNMNPVN